MPRWIGESQSGSQSGLRRIRGNQYDLRWINGYQFSLQRIGGKESDL